MRMLDRSFSVHRFVVAALGSLALSAVAGAQEPNVSLTLQDVRTEVDRLAPGSTSGEASFVVDQASVMEIDAVTTIEAVTTRIVAPTGAIIDAATIGGLGGELTLFEGAAGQDAAVITAAGEPGFHALFRFPSLGPGLYRVEFDGGAGLAQEVAVITVLRTDSPVAAALVATEPAVVVGDTAVLTAAVFEGAQPVAGATVAIALRAPDGTYSNLALTDDGQDPDTAAGDGLYSGEVDPAQAGKHVAVARISGTTAGGLAFVRQAAAQFVATATSSRLTGAFTDSGVDADGDGLFDVLRIQADTTTELDSEYRLFVTLTTALGKTLMRSGAATLAAGNGTVTVDFEAEAIVALRENGPYSLSSLELVRLSPTGAQPAHRLLDVGSTRAYLLTEFQRPELALTGRVSDQAFDDDGNGRFDRLVVDVEVDVLRADFYNWGFKLTDRDRRELGFGSTSGFLNPGLNLIQLTFPGFPIGASRADGPYLLRDLLLFGGGASLVVPDIGQTQSYLARQFEGFPTSQPPIADAGPNQSLECSVPGGAPATLNGSASSDPDNDPLAFEWTNEGGSVVGTAAISSVTAPLGVHPFALKVTDPSGLFATATTQVTVSDTVAPSITALTAEPTEIRVGHDLVPVRLVPSVTDTCDAATRCSIVKVGLLAGPPSRHGDPPDFAITGDLTVSLRPRAGRLYELTVDCVDASLNRSTRVVTVGVH